MAIMKQRESHLQDMAVSGAVQQRVMSIAGVMMNHHWHGAYASGNGAVARFDGARAYRQQ